MDLDRDKRVLNADWCRELVPGTAYFQVLYFEPGVNIPEIQTWIYLGVGRYDDDGAPAYLFQTGDSFCLDGDWSAMDQAAREKVSPESLATFGSEAVGALADIEGLCVLISGLAKRMKLGLGWDRVLPAE